MECQLPGRVWRNQMPRVIETNITEEDIRMEGTLRPQSLDDYIGQERRSKT